MKSRILLFKCILSASLVGGLTPAGATPQSHDFTSYYSYYQLTENDTPSGVASRFGLSVEGLQAMNPGVDFKGEEWSIGRVLCVPKESSLSSPQEVSLERSAKKRRSLSSRGSAASVKSRQISTEKVKESPRASAGVDPTREELDAIASWMLGTSYESKPLPKPDLSRGNRFITSDGRVIVVPKAPKKVELSKEKEAPAKRDINDRVTSKKGREILEILKLYRSQLGVPYVWGGETPTPGFDCSGLIQWAYHKRGLSMPRTADIQFYEGNKVLGGSERAGDLVFFETYAPGASHVGVYVGKGWFLHASSSKGVTLEKLSTPYFKSRYLGARRTF